MKCFMAKKLASSGEEDGRCPRRRMTRQMRLRDNIARVARQANAGRAQTREKVPEPRGLRYLSGPFCTHRPFSHHLAAVIGWQLLPERVTREPKAISLAVPTP